MQPELIRDLVSILVPPLVVIVVGSSSELRDL